jgi:predicted RNA-binding Zn-ribbon protein involved in translation (DUF1610 family)
MAHGRLGSDMEKIIVKMKSVSTWAQVIPETREENLRIYCPYCEENRYDWIINGRSSGLTRTGTTYSCNNCLWKALNTVRWH